MVAVGNGGHPIANPARLSTTTITALAFAGDVVLVGEGNTLKCYDRRNPTSYCLLTKPLFVSQAIHGLLAIHLHDADYIVVAWGGAQLRALVLEVNEAPGSPLHTCIRANRIIAADDWILSCRDQSEVHTSDQEVRVLRIAAVTAHNALLCLQIGLGEKPSDELSLDLQQLSASSRVLLYAASLRWLNRTRVLIAAGSALGDIIVWSCSVNDESTAERISNEAVTKHYDYPAHDGSVFGLDIGAVKAGEVEVLVLASCSDDRTIRVWDISDALDYETTDSMKPSQSEEEGIAGVVVAPCITNTWAHTSRIWQVQFFAACEDIGGGTQLFSFGEDGTCQLWIFAFNTAAAGNRVWSLTHDSTFPNHVGKNMWSHTIRDNADTVYVATGGADSAVVIAEFERRVSQSLTGSTTPQQWTKDDLAKIVTASLFDAQAKLSEVLPAAAAPKAYSFVSPDQVLMTTPGGHVMLGQLSTRGNADTSMSWRYLDTIPSKSYSVTAGLRSHGLGLIGDASGDVYAFARGQLYTKPLLNVGSKVGGVFLQLAGLRRSFERKDDDHIVLLVTRLGHAKANLFRLSGRALFNHTAEELFPTIELDLPDDLVVTSMLFEQLNRKQNLLFLGSRNGYVACYVVDKDVKLLSYTAHHTDAVSALKWKPAIEELEDESGHLLTTGRDSSYAIHSYTFMPTPASPLLVHRIVLPFGPNVEGFYLTEGPQPHLIFFGFHSKDFLVYDETEHNEVMRIDCGGAHRAWAFDPSISQESNSTGVFLWTRAAVLCMSSGGTICRRWVKRGGHGREVKVVAVRPRQHDTPSYADSSIIATGAEDTDIRLFALTSPLEASQPEMKCIGIITKHNTGLQQIQWSTDGQYLFSSAGCEEFFVWRVREVPFVQVGIVCESALPPASELPDLRIMAFDVAQIDDAAGDVDAEFIITIVLSDSTLRVYSYTSSSTTPHWQLLQDGRHTTCCLTQVLHLNSSAHTINSAGTFGLLTASTDGCIAFWSLDLSQHDNISTTKSAARPYHTIKIHQNAITCTQLVPLSSPPLSSAPPPSHASAYLLITGGDDNALAFTRISFPSSSSPAPVPTSKSTPSTSTLIVPRAHAAAIRAVTTKSKKRNGTLLELEIVTSSNDQRIRTWHISFDVAVAGVAGLEVKKGRNLYTALADVADMDVVKGNAGGEGQEEGEGEVEKIVICGVGIDVLS